MRINVGQAAYRESITKNHICQPVYSPQAVLALSNYIREFCL